MSENKSFDELLLPVRNDIDRIDKAAFKAFHGAHAVRGARRGD